MLLDRDSQLKELNDALARAVAGDGGVVLVTGEAGIGKTSLLREFLDHERPDLRQFRGACEDLGIAEPLGPVRGMLQDTEPQLAEALSVPETRFATHSDVLTLLSDNSGGTLMVVEDLHWADDATIDFVRFIARRVVDLPVLLVVSSRAEQPAQRQIIRRAFGELSSDTLHRIALEPLSEKAVAALCAGTTRNPKDLHNASGGNAFYVTEMLRNRGDGLPLSVQDAVLSRTDHLAPEAKAVLELVSVIPRRANFALIEDLLTDLPNLEPAVEGCIDVGLLTSDGAFVSFQHEIARQAVESTLSAFRRRALHRALFDKLSGTASFSLSRLLHHATGAQDSDAVAKLAPQAAASARDIGSFREAAAFYVQAVNAAGDESSADLLEDAAETCYFAGNHTLAADYQARALALIETSKDPRRLGDGLRKLSRYRWLRSDFAGAFEAVDAAIATLSNLRGPELAQAYSSRSQLLMTGYAFDEVEEPASHAIKLADEFNRPDITAHALNNLGMSRTFSDPQGARDTLAQSIKIGTTLTNPDHTARALSNAMHLEFERCEFENALERAEIAADFMKKNELDAYYRYAMGMKARANIEMCRWQDVVAIALQGFDPDDRVPQNYNFNGAIALLNYQIRTGAPRDADVEAHLALFDHAHSEGQRIGPYAEALAERAWLTGQDIDSACERLRFAFDKAAYKSAMAGVHVWLVRLEADVASGDLTHYPDAYRLEIEGDISGAAAAWSAHKAPYQQALTLAFGTPQQQSEALEIFKKLNATPAIARLGGSPDTPAPTRRGRPAASGPFGLTDRQLDVLRQLDKGHSNVQIGENLFISPKTVDHHVSAILAKLDAGSRGEAAAKARELGLI